MLHIQKILHANPGLEADYLDTGSFFGFWNPHQLNALTVPEVRP
jgi:hypothetical protein